MPLVKYDPAGRNCLPPLFFPSLSQRTHAPLCPYRRPYSQHALTPARASACTPRPRIWTRPFCFKASISCSVVFFCVRRCCLTLSLCVCVWLPPATSHHSDNCLSVWIWCLWTRRRHRHEAIVVTLRFKCHTWICHRSKCCLRGPFLSACLYNSLLFCAQQAPVMEKQMPFLCHVMGADAVLCVKGEVRPICRSKLFTSAFHCIWLVCNGRQWHPGLDIRLMYGGEWDRWVCPFPF